MNDGLAGNLIMKTRIYLLIKIFDKEEYADAFMQKGELFCRTLGDFKKSDEEDGRGDRFEAVTDLHQPDQITLTITFKDKDDIEKTFPIEKLAGPLTIQKMATTDSIFTVCMRSRQQSLRSLTRQKRNG